MNLTKYRNNFLVYNKEYLTKDKSIFTKIEEHIKMYPQSKGGRIWYSKPLQEVYSEFQTSLKTHNKLEAFLDNIETWHKGPQGIPRVTAQMNGQDEGNNFYWGRDEILMTNEYFMSDKPEYKKYNKKSILILGAGPTTATSNWKEINYDYLWSMNHFFLSEKVTKFKPDLVSLGNEVDFNETNRLLHKFIEETNCDIIIQPNDVRKNRGMTKFKSKFRKRIGYYSPRWNGKLGAAQRMLLLAIFLKVKNIYIAGIDGYTPFFNKDLGNKGLNSFETHTHFKEGYDYEVMVSQNVIFWQYVLDLKEKLNFNIINLGEGHPANMATEITQKFFKND